MEPGPGLPLPERPSRESAPIWAATSRRRKVASRHPAYDDTPLGV